MRMDVYNTVSGADVETALTLLMRKVADETLT